MNESDFPPPSPLPPPLLYEVEVIPHTMEAHVHKEEALIIQTCALKIDDKEEQSPKQGQEEEEEEHMKENENDAETEENDSPPPPHEVEAILEYEFKNKLLLEEAFTQRMVFIQFGYSYSVIHFGSMISGTIVLRWLFNMPSPILFYFFYIKIEFLFYKKNSIYYYKLHLTLKKMPRMRIQEFTKGVAEYPLHSNGLIDVPKDLADIIESTIGAIFVDCNSLVETVWKVLIHFTLF
ncbi:putative ribonuclease III domain-containing protein [Medicago truncatula]|uniref:Putative ribonuclease III domain-containing protein n=1 Tax=Medicago truncatula TaxID=3880 RepID=A0A396HIH7_MEDTR|nr:putative ribonuclease III domain-containing protein [Medicago truncatula]